MDATPVEHVSRANAAAAPALSFAQERLWIVDKLVDDKALYNATMRLALEGRSTRRRSRARSRR
jgi:hypothetical protein